MPARRRAIAPRKPAKRLPRDCLRPVGTVSLPPISVESVQRNLQVGLALFTSGQMTLDGLTLRRPETVVDITGKLFKKKMIFRWGVQRIVGKLICCLDEFGGT